jgi:glutathione-specific gamma-glutamylcyclotransferase
MAAGGTAWVFGYGSLMWRPGFDYLRAVPARLSGFHRRLCVYSHHYRGTPEVPGLVFGLDRGGACEGVAFEVTTAAWPVTLAYLRERERISDVYREAFRPVEVQGSVRPVQALAFIVNRVHGQYAGKLADDKLLGLISQGHGKAGSCAEYVHNTLEHLRQLDIHDAELERIGRLLGK